MFDDAGRVLDANEAAAQLVQQPLHALKRMHLRDFYHPAELPALEEILRSLQPGEEVRSARWLRCCNGRYIRVLANGKRRTIGGYRVEYEPLSTEQMELPPRD